MNDEELINLIASTWIYHGGDGDGFLYSFRKIHETILHKLELKERD